MNSCIVLAAGLSQRFLSPKALALINGKTIIERTQEMLIESSIDDIVVVLGYEHERIKPHLLKHTKIKFVYNKDYNFGQTSSFKTGLNALSSGSQGVFLLPVDFPAVKVSTIDALISHFNNKNILIPTYRGKKGHPPFFPSSLFKEFLLLEINQGINTISHRHNKQVKCIEVNDSGVVETFNTQEEFEILKNKLAIF